MDDTSCQQLLCPLCFTRVLEQIQRWLCPSSQPIIPRTELKRAPGGATGREQAVGREQAACQEQSCSHFSQRNIPGCSPASPTSPSCGGCVSSTRDARRNHVQRGAIMAKLCLSDGERSSGSNFQSSAGAKNGSSIIHFPLCSLDLKSCAETDISRLS